MAIKLQQRRAHSPGLGTAGRGIWQDGGAIEELAGREVKG